MDMFLVVRIQVSHASSHSSIIHSATSFSHKVSCHFNNPIKVIIYLSTNIKDNIKYNIKDLVLKCLGSRVQMEATLVRFCAQQNFFYQKKSLFISPSNWYFLGFIVIQYYHFWYQNDDNEVHYQMICSDFIIVYI